MAKSIRLPADLIDAAAREACVMGRSASAQVDHWARVGAAQTVRERARRSAQRKARSGADGWGAVRVPDRLYRIVQYVAARDDRGLAEVLCDWVRSGLRFERRPQTRLSDVRRLQLSFRHLEDEYRVLSGEIAPEALHVVTTVFSDKAKFTFPADAAFAAGA